MIIRCPYCEFSRSINERSIPSVAEFVTCPKCKHRFKFRSIEKVEEFSIALQPVPPSLKNDKHQTDIWDAVDALHQKFERQLEENVTDVSIQNFLHPSKQMDPTDRQEDPQRNNTTSSCEQVTSPKKINKKSSQKKKNSSIFSGMLSFLPLLAQKSNEAKPKVNTCSQEQYKQENIGINTSTDSQQQAIDASKEPILTQPFVETKNKDNRLQDSKSNESRERLLPLSLNSSHENQSSQPFLSTKELLDSIEKTETLTEPQNISQQETTSSVMTEVKAGISQKAPLVSANASTSSLNEDTAKIFDKEENREQSTINAREKSIEPKTLGISESIVSEQQNLSSSKLSHNLRTKNSHALDDSSAFRPLFPQNNEKKSLDLRLEKILTLPTTPEGRPSKDLGRLDDIDINKNNDPMYGAPIGNTLWESPISHGWSKSFLHTIRSVMFSSPSFFLKIPGNNGISLAFLFFLLQGYITILFSILWAYLAKDLLDMHLLSIALTNLPFLLLLAPLALGLILLFSAGTMRLFLELFGIHNVPFPLVARIICYSTAPMTLSVIPFIGPPVGALWFFIAMIIAGKRIFSLSWVSSVLLALPAAFSIVTGILMFFL